MTAWDQLDQTLWFVLWNPRVGDQSRTLFGVPRKTSSNTDDINPDIGKWNIAVSFDQRFQYYKFPERILGVTAMKFSPRMTQLVLTSSGPEYGPIDSPTNQRAIVVVASLREGVGPCAPLALGGGNKRCGSPLSRLEWEQHNNATAGLDPFARFEPTVMGTLPAYNAARPPVCRCPSALIQVRPE